MPEYPEKESRQWKGELTLEEVKMGSSEGESFGSRRLVEEERVFEENAWDDVEWDQELLDQALEKVSLNSAERLGEAEAAALETDAARNWDHFYQRHNNRFFKDRKWLLREFPELGREGREGRDLVVLEVGCGAGNTVFPLLAARPAGVFVHASDFAPAAVDLVRASPSYDPARCNAFVWDLREEVPVEAGLGAGSVDVVTAVFVLSALSRHGATDALRRLGRLLAPGGVILFRDYGRHDMAQLRFKAGSCIEENFYRRGDGTRVYFWTEDELREAAASAGLQVSEAHVDRRLVVNRQKRLRMYRAWLQARLCRPGPDQPSSQSTDS